MAISNTRCARSGILLALAFVYFVLYPEDLAALIAPLEKVLNLSFAISPWLYVLLAAGILARALIKTWGRRSHGMDQPVGQP